MKSIAWNQTEGMDRFPVLVKLTLLWVVFVLLGGSAVSSLASDPAGIYAFGEQ